MGGDLNSQKNLGNGRIRTRDLQFRRQLEQQLLEVSEGPFPSYLPEASPLKSYPKSISTTIRQILKHLGNTRSKPFNQSRATVSVCHCSDVKIVGMALTPICSYQQHCPVPARPIE